MKYVYSTIVLLFLALFIPFSVNAQAYDASSDPLLDSARKEAGYSKADRYTFAQQVGGIIKGVMSVLGIVFTALMVYAGILWMTAQGEEDQVSKARDIITAAVIGLIIAVGSYSITDFVVNRVFVETIQTGQQNP